MGVMEMDWGLIDFWAGLVKKLKKKQPNNILKQAQNTFVQR